MNWGGRPLTSHEVIVNSIAATHHPHWTARAGRARHRQLSHRGADRRRRDGRPAVRPLPDRDAPVRQQPHGHAPHPPQEQKTLLEAQSITIPPAKTPPASPRSPPSQGPRADRRHQHQAQDTVLMTCKPLESEILIEWVRCSSRC
ncbi:hypothetical protein [Streptomyces sp. NBC_01012]|uniref:hypothetical protein n=1 Tax=Streptomyces sp. NBC_01012 TaxID=2903717 RepID=UPI00386FDC97